MSFYPANQLVAKKWNDLPENRQGQRLTLAPLTLHNAYTKEVTVIRHEAPGRLGTI